jgi:hypothetical protein
MFYHRPTDGYPHVAPVRLRPRSCFLMTAPLDGSIPPVLPEIRVALRAVLRECGYRLLDADSVATEPDVMLGAWEAILGVPLGIVILHEEMQPGAVAGVFYALGLMQAHGMETLVIRTPAALMPSDFVRAEYVMYGADFKPRMRRFLSVLDDRAAFYATVAEQLHRDPLLAVDFLRRAYLITDDDAHRERALEQLDSSGLRGRARSSAAMLSVNL